MKRFLTALIIAAFAALASTAETKVVAHRGYWKTDGSAQNSLTSIRKADSIAVYGSEMDVWMVGDGELMVSHDNKFRGQYDMETTPSATLRAQTLDNGEKMPTFEEYLAQASKLPDTKLILEMKTLSDLNREDECAAKIVDLLRRYNMLEQTEIISFSINACLAFRKLLPEIPIQYLNGDLAPSSLKKLGINGIDYSMGVLKKHPEWIAEAHSLGMPVNVWTVNSPDDMRLFLFLGADYITTDHPEQLQQILAEK